MIRTVPVASDPRGASDVPTEVSASTMGPAAASGDALARGTEIGRYLVLHRLGAGGMGTVYAAYDPQLDRKVAIKVVASTAASSDHAAARTSQLLREGRVLARLSHPNVVAVHDVGRLGEDIFIAMEYVSGQTLGQWVHTQRPGFAQVLDHYVAAGRALAAAHREDIVHGDFTPANAMVSDTGRVVVLDFGLARAIATGEHPSDSLLATVGGSGGGTPAYMAPEQHRGDPASPAADQFGYCVALYEALCGRRPFAGDTPVAVAANVLEGTPRAPTDAVPKWLWRVLRRGLQTDPRDRFPTFDALLTELDPAPRRRRRRMGLGVLGAVAAAVAVVVASRGPEPCTDASAAQGDAWTADSRDALQRQLAAHPGWPRVRDRLDDAAQRWRDHWTRACRATHVDGSQSADLLDRRMACLERARGHLAAFADGLRDADDETVSRAVAQVGGLDEGARCSDARTLLTRAPPPAEPGDRATYDRIIGQAQRARTEANLQGAASRALDRLAVLEPTADALDHPRAQRFVHQARGDALYGLGRHDEATEAYATAVRHAEIAGDDRAALELATELIHVHASSRDDVVTAAVWSDYADNKLARVEMVSSEARVDLLVHQATLVRRQGDPQTAVTMMDRALELASEDPAARGVIHHNRGIAYFNLAAHELAVGALRQAVELRTAAFGGDHLEVGRSRYHLAHALSAQGEGLAADLELERAIEIFGAHEGTQRQSIVARQSQATLA
ncbi:MAG: protein kinase, partial [Deltaproteobacteria bacterium]|nr:protein kinase [Deltaproteobacteria bacterium]